MLKSPALALPFGRWLIALVAASMLAACATPAHDPATGNEAQIRARYQQARTVYQQRMAPLAQYFVANCAPLADRQYLDCINGKRAEIAAQSIYPEQTTDQRAALEQQFLDGHLDRKQLRIRLEKLRLDDEAAQLDRDIVAGSYSGRY